MSISHPAHSVFTRTGFSSCLRRTFRSSHRLENRKPKHPNIKASELGIVQPLSGKDFRPYSEEEKAALKKHYTPQQIAAIEAGEAAVDTDDIAKQGTFRSDNYALPYIDDLSYIHPVVDKPLRAPDSNYDSNLRLKDSDELATDVARWVENLPEKPTRLDWVKFKDNVRLTVGKEEAERNPRSYLSPELPQIEGLKPRAVPKDGNEDIHPHTLRLMLQTGYTIDQIKKFRTKLILVRRVTNQTRLGKIQTLYFLTVAGNSRGWLGVGEGKSTESEDGRRISFLNAIRNMVPIPRYEERTIFGDVKGKVGATELELMTRPPGTTPFPPV